MGWGSGSYLMNDVIDALGKTGASKETKETMNRVLIPAMRNMDWDTEIDCMGVCDVYDAVLREMFPQWFTEE